MIWNPAGEKFPCIYRKHIGLRDFHSRSHLSSLVYIAASPCENILSLLEGAPAWQGLQGANTLLSGAAFLLFLLLCLLFLLFIHLFPSLLSSLLEKHIIKSCICLSVKMGNRNQIRLSTPEGQKIRFNLPQYHLVIDFRGENSLKHPLQSYRDIYRETLAMT